MEEHRLPGGNTGGAVLVDGTVRRAVGPWTSSVHALLSYLEEQGFAGAPRVLGFDEQGREVLSYLPGRTVGDRKPWPLWVHSDAALVDVGRWLRCYHDTVAGFVPPPEARWRGSDRPWRLGDVIGHNDAAPYNAVWTDVSLASDATASTTWPGQLVGFIDWDFAAPCAPVWDLAFCVFAWVPLLAREVAAGDGFTRFDQRPARLRRLLEAYEFAGTVADLLDVVAERVEDHARGVRDLALAGDPFFAHLLEDGVVNDLERALDQLRQDRHLYEDSY